MKKKSEKIESKENPLKKKNGRPTIYTDELAKEICDVIACTGTSVQKMCDARPHWPARETIFHWLTTKPQFLPLYTQAKTAQIEVFIDQTIEISDDSSEDEIVGKNGKTSINREFVERSKLKVAQRNWMAERLKPIKYGIKTQITNGGDTFKVESLTKSERIKKMGSIVETILNRAKNSVK